MIFKEFELDDWADSEISSVLKDGVWREKKGMGKVISWFQAWAVQ